jgi:hypothetical protein
MAEINISNLGGGGGGTLTLTTTGTGGASTYVAGVLNIPVYQSALTNPVTGTGTATRVAFWDSASSVSSSANLYWDDSNSRLGVGTATPGARLQVNGSGLTSGTTGLSVKDSGGTDNFTVADNGATFVRGVLTISGSSASNSATLMGRTSTGEVTSVTLGTNLSFSGNTLNATGGGTPAGSTGEVQFNNAGSFGASSNFNWDNTNSRLGIRTATPGASLQINGAGATSGTSSLLINNSGASELFRVSDNGLISVGKNVSVSTQSSSQIQAVSGDAATNIVITPKGTGAFILGPAPDGTTVGGNARGLKAVDLLHQRNAAIQVASGNYSALIGGYQNRASGESSGVFCSDGSSATANSSTVFASSGSSNGQYYSAIIASSGSSTGGAATGGSVILCGTNSSSNVNGALVVGDGSSAHLNFSIVHASGRFATSGDAQNMRVQVRRSITGTAAQDLFINGSSTQLVIPANRAWNARVQLTAICTTAGGTVSVGDTYTANYSIGIKRITNATSLVGTMQTITAPQSDASMSTSTVTMSADDTNEALVISFTPPTTAGAGTIIRVVATVEITVVGY